MEALKRKRIRTRNRIRQKNILPSNDLTNIEMSGNGIMEGLTILSINEPTKFVKEIVSNNKASFAVSKNIDRDVPQLFLPHLNGETIKLLEQHNVIFLSNIRINQKNPYQAYLPNSMGDGDCIVEGVLDRNRSLDGDLVYAMLKCSSVPSGAKCKSAVVVGIKEFVHNRVCVGTILQGTKKLILYPSDNRLPKVRLSKDCLPPDFQRCKIGSEDLFCTTIVDWPNDRQAIGGPVTFLGRGGTSKAECEAIILTHDLDVTPYPDHFNRYFPKSLVNSDYLKDRMDCRNLCIFSIDPATAKDLDDAMSCELKENGGYTIGVHISDVSNFLSEGTELDAAVSKRATTVYLVDEVYHMLPKPLCALCSLTPGEDKLAFSVFFEFSEEGELLSHSFKKTVIKSCAQLSYEQVEEMLTGNCFNEIAVCNEFSNNDIVRRVNILNKQAKILRSARIEAGALRIDQVKISFIFDERGKPVNFTVPDHLDSHKLIEEFMLLANIAVAHKIQEGIPELALLRHHSPPAEDYLKRLQSEFERYGVVFDISSSKALQDSINRYSLDNLSERSQVMIINNALTKPMKRANYFCNSVLSEESEKRHYALSIPLYTHFTSPIRRYADVIVHRLLATVLNYRTKPQYTADYVQSIAQTCNKKKYSAKLAGDASIELHFALLIGQRGNLIVEAVVCHVANQFFEAIVLTTGSHVKVYYNTIDGKVEVEKEDLFEAFIKWTDGPEQKISMFSIVNLELTRGKSISLDARLLPLFPGTI